MASSSLFKPRDEWKKLKELEEARKAGTAAPEVDAETGQDINPHIPQYIASAPWYLSASGPSLKHQRFSTGDAKEAARWYSRGAVKGPAATKFRKGACENCGSMAHKAKDCFERPRKVSAKQSATNIRPDEVVETLDFDYTSKRDRWQGYDPKQFTKVMETYEKTEEMRKQMKEKSALERRLRKLAEKQAQINNRDATAEGAEGEQEDEFSDDSSDGNSDYEEQEQSVRAGEDVKASKGYKQSVRDLRIREDTAKYLYNLDTSSAYYDPKTRSMRENPNPQGDKVDEFTGDNYVRYSGDTKIFRELELFSYQSNDKGQNVHVLGAPSQAELLMSEFRKKKDTLLDKKKSLIMSKYGSSDSTADPEDELPRELLLGQTEAYVEYARDGRLIRGVEKPQSKSRYDEDVFVLQHTSVWGSYWVNQKWGYACCRQTIRNSLCTGVHASHVKKAVDMLQVAIDRVESGRQSTGSASEGQQSSDGARSSSSSGGKNSATGTDAKKRGRDPASYLNGEFTETDMEDYLHNKLAHEDPMAAYLNK